MSTGGSRQDGDRAPIAPRNTQKTAHSMGAMTVVGAVLLVMTILVAISAGGPTGQSYVIGAFALALLIGGRIIDAIRSRR